MSQSQCQYHRYVMDRRPPARLTYRNGTIALEIVRDCALPIPTWVFRARRLDYSRSANRAVISAQQSAPVRSYRTDPATGCRLPTVSPIERAAALEASERSIVIATSDYGRSSLEQVLRDGVVLEAGAPAARVMDALVKLHYARRMRATARDL